jgi:hypothetical protein
MRIEWLVNENHFERAMHSAYIISRLTPWFISGAIQNAERTWIWNSDWGRCRYEMVLIYQPPNAHVQISGILLSNAMAAPAVKKITSCTYSAFHSAPLLSAVTGPVEIGPIPMRATASTVGSKPRLYCHRSTQYIVHLCRRSHSCQRGTNTIALLCLLCSSSILMKTC